MKILRKVTKIIYKALKCFGPTPDENSTEIVSEHEWKKTTDGNKMANFSTCPDSET